MNKSNLIGFVYEDYPDEYWISIHIRNLMNKYGDELVKKTFKCLFDGMTEEQYKAEVTSFFNKFNPIKSIK